MCERDSNLVLVAQDAASALAGVSPPLATPNGGGVCGSSKVSRTAR